MEAIIDGSLDAGYKPESVQMIAELAIRCVRPHERPSSSEVVREIEDAIRVELQVEAPQQMPLESDDSDDSQPLDSEPVDLEQLYNEMIHRPSQPSWSSQRA